MSDDYVEDINRSYLEHLYGWVEQDILHADPKAPSAAKDARWTTDQIISEIRPDLFQNMCDECGLPNSRHSITCSHIDCGEDDQAVHGCGPKYGPEFGEDYFTLFDSHGEIVHWTVDEWEEDPQVVFSMLNALKLFYEEGATAVRARVTQPPEPLIYIRLQNVPDR